MRPTGRRYADPVDGSAVDALRERWVAQWPTALLAWGRYTRLPRPTLHGLGEAPDGVGSFAWFSCTDVEVHIDLADILARGLEDHAVAVLAHEVGHHVLSPGDLSTAARLVARARDGLVDVPDAAPMIANLWSDLLINDRLQRRSGIAMDALWRAIGPPRKHDVVMQFVARTYEMLWSLPSGTLTRSGRAVPEAEAGLCARLVRAYADESLGGVGGFAALVRRLAGPDFDEEQADGGSASDAAESALRRIGTGRPTVCAQHGEAGGEVVGLSNDPALGTPVLHPALDPRVVGAEALSDGPDAPPDLSPAHRGQGQSLSPAAYHAVLAQLGLSGSIEESARRWYREQAARYLVPFPTRAATSAVEPLLAAHEPWEVSDDLGDVDWTSTLLRSPIVVPGVTTVRRGYDDAPGAAPDPAPVDLDLYLDSSGSMPDPRAQAAPVALAGAVLALSALRSGARVQATTWSGPDQIAGTDGFTRDPDAVLAVVVAYFGGGTSFPLPMLAGTHLRNPARAQSRLRPCHIAVISDGGVVSMFGVGQPAGSDSIAERAVRAAGGGGSLILCAGPTQVAQVAALAPGYDVYGVVEWADLVGFARDFVRRTWRRDQVAARTARGGPAPTRSAGGPPASRPPASRPPANRPRARG